MGVAMHGAKRPYHELRDLLTWLDDISGIEGFMISGPDLLLESLRR